MWLRTGLLLLATAFGLPGGRAAADSSRSATLPFALDHNRMTVEIEFARPDGSARRARAWVDTGSPDLALAEPLARELGLDVSGADGGAQSGLPVPFVRLGGMALDLDGIRTRIRPGAVVLPGVTAEACLPAAALRHHHVVFDYPARRLTVAQPGFLRPRGIGLACRVNAVTGLVMITAIADGDTVPLGLDSGSAGTWVSTALTGKWLARHSDWPRATGAAGSANFFGFPFECEGILLCLPALTVGDLPVRDVALLGLDQSLFDWYSAKSAGPVLGFLGANVLTRFRLEIDFPNRMTYWEAGPADGSGDLDIVGITLRPEADGGLTVAGVVRTRGRPAVEGVQPGDRLVRVDSLGVAESTMGEVADALRGAPGSPRTLVIERQGRPLTIVAKVLRLP